MVWKRNFLFLVCFGSLFAFVIFFKYRDEAITSSSHSFIGSTDLGRMQSEGFLNSSVNRLTNRQLLEGNSIAHDMYNYTLSYQSQPQFLKMKEHGQGRPVITLALQKDFLKEATHKENSSHRTVTDISGRINSSAASHTAVKSLSDKYSRVFQWNDKDPDGWKTLPLSKSGTASKMERVIFNRVGKCGSRSMINLLRDLAQKNNFNLISSVVYSNTHIPKSWEKHIVSVLDRVQPPYMFQRHLHYVNFKRHNASEVVYINIIREPIPRMVSQYYYARFGDAGEDIEKRRKIWPRREEEFNETVDECVQKQRRDCMGHKTFYIIPFFCGNSKHCIKSSRWALHRAISNVEKHFLVVGILEEFELSLQVLERMLPEYFEGASKLYHSPKMAANMSRTSTNLKVLPSNETLALLRASMKYEYQFYEYIKNRLFKQKEMLGL